MAVAVEATFRGATLAQYDEAINLMGLSCGGRHPGALFHWVADTDDGFRVTDVWESREEFERFFQEQVGAIGEQMDLTEPELRYTDVHCYMTGG
jgi:hypothetical protein